MAPIYFFGEYVPTCIGRTEKPLIQSSRKKEIKFSGFELNVGARISFLKYTHVTFLLFIGLYDVLKSVLRKVSLLTVHVLIILICTSHFF